MKIVMTGGGSGGHITPLLAIAHELRRVQPDAFIVYIGQRGDRFGDVVSAHDAIDETFAVSAGKFRRYHGEGIRQLVDVQTLWLNCRDMFRTIAGVFQSYRLLRRLAPDVLFCKGGFVGVPVGLAAKLLGIPYITHDSDAIPGLANRLIGRWAEKNAVAYDPSHYPYPLAKTINVGVPISAEYRQVTDTLQKSYRKELELDSFSKILLVTGGGLGAQTINRAMLLAAPSVLSAVSGLCIVHVSGATNEEAVRKAYAACLAPEDQRRVSVVGYTSKLAAYSGAADVVVARGGATSFAELATQGKASIIIPNPFLTGGHQVKNAQMYKTSGAAIILDELKLKHNHELLEHAIRHLLEDDRTRTSLQTAMLAFSRPNATMDIAQLIVDTAKESHAATS